MHITSCTELYRAELPVPVLHGQRCGDCGALSFPPNPYGCERCGASHDRLAPQELAGAGELLAFATVHLHPGDDIDAPFTVGVIELDDGPCVRATLIGTDDRGLYPGMRMEAQVTQQRGAEELRFAPAAREGSRP
jgi:uncharacterized protein